MGVRSVRLTGELVGGCLVLLIHRGDDAEGAFSRVPVEVERGELVVGVDTLLELLAILDLQLALDLAHLRDLELQRGLRKQPRQV